MKTKFLNTARNTVTYVARAVSSVLAFVENNSKSIIALLALMNAFGMIAPDTATSLRDALLGLN